MRLRDHPTIGRQVVPIASIAAVVALLVAVALVSGGDGDAGELELPSIEYLLLGAFEVGLLAGLVALVFIRPGAPSARRRNVQRGFGILTLVLAIAVAVLFERVRGDEQDEQDANQPSVEGTQPEAESEDPVSGGDTALVVLVIAAGAALAAVAAGRARRARADDALDVHDAAADVSDVLDDAIDALRRETDPRRAVIAAYGRMEQTLGYHRMPRRPAEAPLEYLARALRWLDAGTEAVRRLTDLFEEAMFSEHHMGPAEKDEAIDALIAVRDDLRAPV